MTKQEFLDKLRAALGNDLSGPVIQENVNYYNSYISEEVRKGKTEEEVTAELGDPWVIAQTIIDSVDNRRNPGDTPGEAEGSYEGRQNHTRKIYSSGFDTWWKKLFLILGILGVVVLVGAVIGGIISLVAPLLVPILIIMLVFRVFGNRR